MTNDGRPSLYKPEYCAALIAYFSVKPYIIDADDKPVTSDFPTLAGFAISLGVSRDTLHEWTKVHPDFSDAYKRAKDYQENYFAINGLKGLINTNFGIFTAKNVLGWRDKQPEEVSQINLNVGSLSDEELVKIVQEHTSKKDKA